MKQICDPEDLRKSLEAANLLQFVARIEGEMQKQLNGIMLPACEVFFKENVNDNDKNQVNTIVAQKVALDWPTLIKAEQDRLAAIDADNKESVLQQVANMTNEEYNTWWGARTAAQKDAILKRILRIICRRLLS